MEKQQSFSAGNTFGAIEKVLKLKTKQIFLVVLDQDNLLVPLLVNFPFS